MEGKGSSASEWYWHYLIPLRHFERVTTADLMRRLDELFGLLIPENAWT